MNRTHVDVVTYEGRADSYLVDPGDGENHPGVLLLIDAFGLRPRIEAMADRIAERGYVVLAPNVFYRAGRAPVLPFPDMSKEGARAKFVEDVRPLTDELTPERVLSDGSAYLDALAEFSIGPFAITGYCLGARLGLRIANAEPERVAALGGFHGARFVTDGPDSPHHSIDSITAETYLGHADGDPSNPSEQIEALDDALGQAGIAYRSEVYEGAAHGYTMADMPVYDEAATERHFAALFDLLDRRL